MAVSFVNSAIATATSSVTTLIITYAPTAGNLVHVGSRVNAATASGSCKDNNGNALTANPNNFTTTWQFYGTAVAGATAYTLTFGNARLIVGVLGEYAGISGVGTTISNTATSTNPAITMTTSHLNSWSIATFGNGAILNYVALTGNLRNQAKGNTGQADLVGLVDNAGTTIPSTVVCAVTLSSTTYQALAVEIFPPQPFNYNQLSMVGCGT